MGKIVEINGIKLEIDERTATVQQVNTFKVGDAVKLLLVETYGAPSVKFGAIVGFDMFKSLPTITVAYMDFSEIKYALINANMKHEILKVEKHDLAMDKVWILDRMKAKIVQKQNDLDEEKRRFEVFTEQFGQYFETLPNAENIVS